GLARATADTVADVERVYWTLVAARREVDVRAEAVRLAEDQRGETEQRIRAGTAPETEAAQPRAELERRRGELLAARESVARAENALKLLVAGDGDSALWSDTLVPTDGGEPTIEPVDVGAAMTRALAARPEVAAQQAVVERRRAERALALDAVRPALDAVVAYDRYGLAGTRHAGDPASRLLGNWTDSLALLRDGDLDDTRVGLVFALPLGNRTAKAGAEVAKSVEIQ